MEKISKMMDYLFLTSIILLTNTIYVNSGYKIKPYLMGIIILTLFVKIVTIKLTYKYLKQIGLILGSYFFMITILHLIHLDESSWLYNYVIFPSIIIIVFFENYRVSVDKILDRMVKIISFLAYVSLFFWLFGSVLNIIAPTSYVINAWTDGTITPSYYNLHFDTQRVSFLGIHFIRNSGIFAEGPMWNLMLSLALMIQILLLPKNNKREILLIFTIFTVASTTGIFIVGILLIYKVLIYLKGVQKFVSLITFPFLIYGLMQVFDEKASTSSASIRVDDFIAGIRAWKESIFFGSGFYNGLKVLESYMNTGIRSNLGNSDSFVLILAQGGVLLGMLYFYPMFKILFSNKYTINLKIFSILYFIILITSIFVDTPLFALMTAIFYGFVSENSQLDEKMKKF